MALVDEIETILSDDHVTLFRYVDWHIGDYITGTMGMTLEIEGAYQRYLVRLYERGKPLPDDDRFMATLMNLSIRVWRRVKEALVTSGKILLKAGYLTNARFEKERVKRAEQMVKQSESARARWAKVRAEKEGLPEVSAKFAPSLPEVSPKLSANVDEKPNENNVIQITTHMPPNTQYPIPIKETPTNPQRQTSMFPELVAAVAAGVMAASPMAAAAAPVEPAAIVEQVRAPKEVGPAFEEFWSVYPNKKGKAEAIKIWDKLKPDDRRAAIESVAIYCRSKEVLRGYAKHGRTYLHQKIWMDYEELAPVQRGAPPRMSFRYAPACDDYGAPIPMRIRVNIENSERGVRDEELLEMENA
jgi:uncharacterized protein YdaU (DUF1376 family)